MAAFTAFNALRPYVHAFREEPKLRAYVAACFVDDIGVAAAAWATDLLNTNLFVTQRARASFVLPCLACFLVGSLLSGPLADWAARHSDARLARWRWRLVVWARLIESLMLGSLLLELAAGPPTIAKVLPFAMLTAFTKTAFRPARTAFAVDLLTRTAAQRDAHGRLMHDERGQPLEHKVHLLTLNSLVDTLTAAAVLGGLLVGGQLLALAHGSYAPLFVVQASAQLGFVAVVALFCHPTKRGGEVRLRELVADPEPALPLAAADSVRYFARSLVDGFRFLAQREQRTLVCLLAGSALVEFVTESYDGKMIIKHVLHGSDDAVRYAEIGWIVFGLIGVALVPALTRATGSIGRIFVVTMLLDGLVVALAGRSAAAMSVNAIAPFTAVLVLDHGLTLVSTSLAGLAQSSASSAAMRGRIAGSYALIVIVGDMLVEQLATLASEQIGIPAMLVRVGILQVGFVSVLLLIGGRSLWRFGLHEDGAANGGEHSVPSALENDSQLS